MGIKLKHKRLLIPGTWDKNGLNFTQTYRQTGFLNEINTNYTKI